jgi:antitoxin component HigA of HigAB toxin-antitoxin module
MEKPIKTEADCEAALGRIEALWGAAPGLRQATNWMRWPRWSKAYESEHHAGVPPDPVEAIRIRLEQEGK